MRFLVTMNMPSYSGNPVHQMHVEHHSASLDAFVDTLANSDFVIVEEFYKDRTDADYYSRGKVAINYRYVGKIKEIKTFSGETSTYRRDRYDDNDKPA